MDFIDIAGILKNPLFIYSWNAFWFLIFPCVLFYELFRERD